MNRLPNLNLIPLLLLCIFISQFAVAQTVEEDDELVAIEVMPASAFEGTPDNFINLNGITIFTENFGDPVLWVSNGTPAGTKKITFPEWTNVDLSSERTNPKTAVSDSLLYFLAQVDGSYNIWVTDGTQEGTKEAVNSTETGFSGMVEMRSFGNRIAFIAWSPDESYNRLFLINENGTGAIKVSGIDRIHMNGIPPRLAVLDDNIYTAEGDGLDRNLMRLDQDGNVTQAWQMPENSTAEFRTINALTAADDQIFFSGNDGLGFALWAYSNGSASRMFSVDGPDEGDKEQESASNIITAGNDAYFFSSPWDEENRKFTNNSYLYISNGTKSGTRQLWISDLDNGYTGIDAANLPVAAAGNRLLFEAPYGATTGSVYWGVGTTSSSFEPIEIEGETFSPSINDSDPVSSSDGAWFSTSGGLVFTNGTSDGSFKIGPEELQVIRGLSVINDMAWFSAKTDYFDDSSLWRVVRTSELQPEDISLLQPNETDTTTSLLPEFSWKVDDQSMTYQLQISYSEDFGRPIYDFASIADTTFMLEDSLSFSTRYYWRVRGESAGNVGEWSNPNSFKTIMNVPEDVALSAPANNAIDLPTTPDFEWNENSHADSFHVQISLQNDFSHLILDSLITENSFTPNMPLKNDSLYFWRVKAINIAGESNWSSTWNFKTIASSLSTVRLLVPENESEEVEVNPEFIWEKQDAANSYQLQLSTNQNFTELIVDSTSITDTTFTHENNLEELTQYWWRIRAENDAGSGDWSTAWNLTTLTTTDIDGNAGIPAEVALHQNFPNPFNPTTNISYQMPEAGSVSLVIYDMLGREITTLVNERVTAGNHEITFDAGGLSSGMYIYRLETGNEVFTRKLMLIK